MNVYRSIFRPLLFRLDPERCHNTSIRLLEFAQRVPRAAPMFGGKGRVSDGRLATEVCGIRFENPIGLAAGFDKSGRAIEGLARFGFGHLEIGSVSADPSAGNPKPRLFRLVPDRAILVHYGLPNDGSEVVAKRLSQKRASIPIGVNIVTTNRGVGAAAESEDEIIKDYVRSVQRLKDHAGYLALNLSCPNTAQGRDFFAVRGNTRTLLSELGKLNIGCPVFLKVSAAADGARMEALLEEVEGIPLVSGFAFNLTSTKPAGLVTPRHVWENRPGAVSGRPVNAMINEAIRNLYARMDSRRYRLVAAGGVFSAEDAYVKIRLGASLVQILTSLIYEGPGIVGAINRGLSRLLARDGFTSVGEAVGTLNRACHVDRTA